jgi:hypothetical protein
LNNLNGSSISGFSALLYVNFIIKKKYRVDDVAREMQIASDTLYRYVRGENIIPPDRISDLVKATSDVEYLEFFCEPIGYAPVPIPQTTGARKDSLQAGQIHLSILGGESLKAIEESLADGHLNKIEKKKCIKALSRLQAKAAELKEKIDKAEVMT